MQNAQRSKRMRRADASSSRDSTPVSSVAHAGKFLLLFADYRARYLSIAAALTLLNWVIYAPVVHYGFVDYDDPAYVWDNPHVFRGLSWHGVAWAFTHGYASNWHPLTWISHMADVQAY